KRVRAETTTIRRQAIILLTDGEDTSSVIGFDDILDSVKRSEVCIYTIALKDKDELPNHSFDEADYVMRTLAQETGGRAYRIDDVAQLAGAYQLIADELASQYALGYAPKNGKRDGAWRRIAVRVDHPNVTARTKTGYFAPSSPQ